MTYSPSFRKGDWLALCDRCGFKYKASKLKQTWDHLKVCKDCWEPRQPQDFLRGKKDDQSVPWTRPEVCPVNVDTVACSVEWTVQTSGVITHLRSVWEEGGLWVAVGDSGVILTSSNAGVTWTSRTSGTTNSLRTVKYWNSNWWVVGRSGATTEAIVLKSADGITWATISAAGTDTELVDIAFNDTAMAFIGWDTQDFIVLLVTTTDGTTFNSPVFDALADFGYGITWNSADNLWGAVGSQNSGDEWFETSSDLTTWTEKAVGATGELWTIDHDGTNWLVAENLTKIYTSPDSTTWTNRPETEMTSNNPWRITHNDNGCILLCGGFTAGKIILSNDNGVTWSVTYGPDANAALMSKAIYGGGIWVAIGWSGRIITGVETLTTTDVPAGTFTNSL